MTVRELLVKIGFDMDKAKIKRAEDAIQGIKCGMEGLAGMAMQVAAAIGVALGVQEVVKTADAWTQIEARIGLVTKSAEEQKQVMNEIYNISNKTGQSFEASAELYTKVARASELTGASQKDALALTDMVNKSLVLSQADTAQAQAAILQLGQALSSGVLQGDELRSLGEAAPELLHALADGLGVTRGEIKDMGKEGELTSKVVIKALLKQKYAVDKAYGSMPLTMGKAFQIVRNKFGWLVNDFSEGTQFFADLAKGIAAVANEVVWAIEAAVDWIGGWENALYLVASALTAVGIAIVAMNIPAFVAAMVALLANPATWMFLGIAAAVMAVALALQDLYVWIQGGDSLIGDYLGSWQDFYKEHKDTIDGFINFFKSAWEFIKALFSGDTDEMSKRFGDMFGKDMIGTFEAFVNAFKTGWQILKSFFGTIVESLKNGWKFWTSVFSLDFGGAVEAIKAQLKNLYTHFVNMLTLWVSFLGRTLDGMVELVRSKLGDGIANIFAAMVAMLRTGWHFFLSWFKGDMVGVLNAIGQASMDCCNLLIALWLPVWALIKDAAKHFFIMIIQAAGNMVASLGELINACVNALTEKFRGALEAVKSFFAGLRDYVMGILQDISGGIGTFIVDKIKQGLGMLSKLAGVNLGGMVTPGQMVSNNNRTNYLEVSQSAQFYNEQKEQRKEDIQNFFDSEKFAHGLGFNF